MISLPGIEDHISEIYIKEPNLQVLPRDSVDFLRRLTVLSVEESSISEPPKVKGLDRLKLLRIDGSNVRTLPELKDLPALRYWN